jgi:hypothetical protein
VGFTGIPAAGVEFYERLGADNTKSFWQANRSTFDDQVRHPMTELCEALEGYGPFHLFRPHNDLRFSKNKPPYKTHQGAYGESEGGVAKDHPRIALLRRKGLMVSKDLGAPAWLHTKRVVSKVREVWEASEPMCAWLDRHVGPSTLPPPEFG